MSRRPSCAPVLLARFRGSIPSTRVAGLSAALSAALPAALLATASGLAAAAPSTLPIPDPALNMLEGQLPILPGWKGNATVDRTSDPFANGTAALSIDVQSPDGTRGYRALPVAFHTFSPAVQRIHPPIGPRQPAAFMAFRSTAEVLTTQILPRLNLGGEASAPFAIDPDKVAKAAAMQAANGLPNPFVDAAAVLVKGGDGSEFLVEAFTFGSSRGMPGEMSMTHVYLFRAPAGQARALHDEIVRLPEIQPTPAWIQADHGLFEQKMAALKQQNSQIHAATASNDAAFAAWQKSSAAQRASYDQHNAAWARGNQIKSDQNAAFAGYIGDHDVSYKWCNGQTGETRFVTNSTQSPGAGFARCS